MLFLPPLLSTLFVIWQYAVYSPYDLKRKPFPPFLYFSTGVYASEAFSSSFAQWMAHWSHCLIHCQNLQWQFRQKTYILLQAKAPPSFFVASSNVAEFRRAVRRECAFYKLKHDTILCILQELTLWRLCLSALCSSSSLLSWWYFTVTIFSCFKISPSCT